MENGKPCQRLEVDIPAMGDGGVAEEHDPVEIACGDQRAELLVAAASTALQPLHHWVQRDFGYHLSRAAGADQPMPRQRRDMSQDPGAQLGSIRLLMSG